MSLEVEVNLSESKISNIDTIKLHSIYVGNGLRFTPTHTPVLVITIDTMLPHVA